MARAGGSSKARYVRRPRLEHATLIRVAPANLLSPAHVWLRRADEGGWKADKFNGRGSYTFRDGMNETCVHRNDRPVGSGVRWSADRAKAWRLLDGQVQAELSVDEAGELEERVGATLFEERTPRPASAPALAVVVPRVHASSGRS